MTAPVEDMKPDRVQFLATSAQLVGEDRALAAAHRDLGADDLVEALAFLQPPAATGAAKRHLAKPEALLTSLRDAGDEPTDVDPPEPAAAAPLLPQLGPAGRRVRPVLAPEEGLRVSGERGSLDVRDDVARLASHDGDGWSMSAARADTGRADITEGTHPWQQR